MMLAPPQMLGRKQSFQIQSCADGPDYTGLPDRREHADGLVAALDIA